MVDSLPNIIQGIELTLMTMTFANMILGHGHVGCEGQAGDSSNEDQSVNFH